MGFFVAVVGFCLLFSCSIPFKTDISVNNILNDDLDACYLK